MWGEAGGRGYHLDMDVRKKGLSKEMSFWQRPERNDDLVGRWCLKGKN